MAVIVNGQNQEEDKDKQQGSLSVSGTPTAAISATPQAPTTSSAGRDSKGSGRFTNLQKYIQASGPGAGQKLAGEIGQTVGKQTKELGKSIEQAQGINPQLEAERQRIAQASGFAQQIQQDPTKLLPQLQQFTQLRTGQSAIPQLSQQAQQAFTQAQNQLGDVQKLAGLTGTESGRFELLRQSLGRPSYTRGQQRLDQLLLQAGGGDVLGKLQQDTTQQARAGEQFLGAEKSAMEKGLAQTGQAAQTASQQLIGAIGRMDDPSTPDIDESKDAGALGSLQQALRQKQKDYITQQDALKTAIESGKSTDQFSNEALQALGLRAGQKLYDVNLNELINPAFSSENVTEQNIANSEDLARYQAIAQLAGVDPSYLNSQAIGTAKGVETDLSNLRNALTSASSRYSTLVQQPNQNLPDRSISMVDLLKGQGYLPYTGPSNDPAQLAAYIKNNAAALLNQNWGAMSHTWYDQQIKNAQDWANRYYGMNPERIINPKTTYLGK